MGGGKAVKYVLSTKAGQSVQSSAVWIRINSLFDKMVPKSRRAKPAVYASWYSWLQEKLDALFGQDVQTLAQGLHWYAYREQVVGRAFGSGRGPAIRILELLWQQFALGRGSMVSIKSVVREPQGWLVIADLMN